MKAYNALNSLEPHKKLNIAYSTLIKSSISDQLLLEHHAGERLTGFRDLMPSGPSEDIHDTSPKVALYIKICH